MFYQWLLIVEEAAEALEVEVGWFVNVGEVVGHGEEFACG